MALKDKAKETATATEEKTTTGVAETTTTAVSTETSPSVFIQNAALIAATQEAEYGDYPSIVANNGEHTISGEDDNLGKKIKFHVVNTRNVKKVIPGENTDEAKEYFAAANEGQLLSDGRSIEEALQDAKDAGYDKASIKNYIDVFAHVIESENEAYVGEIVVLQLAPSSVRNWKKLHTRCATKAAMGSLVVQGIEGLPQLGESVCFQSTAKGTSWKGNSYTVFEFDVV